MSSSADNSCEYSNKELISIIENIYPLGERISLKKLKQLEDINYWLNRHSRAEQIVFMRMGNHFRDLYREEIMTIFNNDIEEYKISPERRKICSDMVKSQALFELSEIFGCDVSRKDDITDLYNYFIDLGNGDIERLFK